MRPRRIHRAFPRGANTRAISDLSPHSRLVAAGMTFALQQTRDTRYRIVSLHAEVKWTGGGHRVNGE